MSEVGTAIVALAADGTREVEHADPVILVSQELLDNAEPDVWDGQVLTLDSTGDYRYRRVGPGPQHDQHVFERLDEPSG